jgi:hypothetical protein
MQAWEHLVKQGILGTGGFSLPATEEPLLSLIQQIQDRPVEEQFLHTAALLDAFRQTGQLPSLEKKSFPAALAESEEWKECSENALALLKKALDIPHRFLILEWIQNAYKAKKRVPYTFIPRLLEQGVQQKNIRPYLKFCLGERGRWLARLSSEWNFFEKESLSLTEKDSVAETVKGSVSFEDLKKKWEVGESSVRLEVFEILRSHFPEKTQDLLEEGWSQETAKERLAFLKLFRISLSKKDEGFLLSCLKDKSKNVKEEAMVLLGSLSDSQWTQERLKTLSTFISVVTKKKKSLKIELPEEYDKTWDEVGMKEAIPEYSNYYEEKLGKKAWWLIQMMRLVAPSHFMQHLGIEAKELPSFLEKHEFSTLFSTGIYHAALHHHDKACAVLMVQQSPLKRFVETFLRFRPILSREDCFSLVQEHFKTHQEDAFNGQTASFVQCLTSHTEEDPSKNLPLDVAFSLEILPRFFKNLIEQEFKTSNYYSRESFKTIALFLAPESFPTAENLIKEWNFSQESVKNCLEEFLNIFHFRYQIYKEFHHE